MSNDKSSMDDGKEPVDPVNLAEAPGDVAGLYSWAKLKGAKYRDFSASRDEARASRRLRERASAKGQDALPAAAQAPRRLLTAVKKGAAAGSRLRPVDTRRWAGLQSVFGTPDAVREAKTKTQVVLDVPSLAFVSLAGGVGKTSLAASMSQALAALGERLLLVDTQGYGLLPLIFGTHGASAAEVTVMTLESGAAAREDGLMEDVARRAEDVQRVLVDVASGSMELMRQAICLSSAVLVVLTPDMASVVSLQAMGGFLRAMEEEMGRELTVHYLLNQFDPTMRLHVDIQKALAGQLGDRLLPFCVHASDAMREALAEGMTVERYAPGSGAAEEVRRLAEWVRAMDEMAVPRLRWRES